MAEKQMEIARQQEHGLSSRERYNPLQFLERFADEVDRVFSDFGIGRGWFAPRLGADLISPLRRAEAWIPEIEVLQRSHELVIRADLPGLAKDDIKVEITDNAVTIHGERKKEHEEEKAGIYRSERSYGSFYRVVALPEGVMADQAKANFKNGVLEIAMPAPPETVTRGRKLEITEPKK
jgi:HSP20 family protein